MPVFSMSMHRSPIFSDDKLNQGYDELFGVNVKGCIFGGGAALPELRKTGGSMIFTASVAGLNSGGGGVLYTASKHAVVGLIRELAVELGPDIRVNGVAPGGPIDGSSRARFTRRGRSVAVRQSRHRRTAARRQSLTPPLMPDDLAGAYVFLASRRNARGATGSIVTVDAGAMLRMPRRMNAAR